ncbi:MAG: hypothetical protein II666_02825 [Butyrivibrio sp.]|nr:hypothetical protein [Butyrivibrio sp.]
METVRIHRVGTITAGITLIVLGAAYILNFFGYFEITMVTRLWPIILIGVGVEILISSFEKSKVVYDKAAMLVMFAMIAFAMFMACWDRCVIQEIL